MSGVYIKWLQMPESMGVVVTIYPDGRVVKHALDRVIVGQAIPVPDHGRLVEANAVVEQIDEWLDTVGYATVGKSLSYYGELLGCVEDAPTIISADKEGEHG